MSTHRLRTPHYKTKAATPAYRDGWDAVFGEAGAVHGEPVEVYADPRCPPGMAIHVKGDGEFIAEKVYPTGVPAHVATEGPSTPELEPSCAECDPESFACEAACGCLSCGDTMDGAAEMCPRCAPAALPDDRATDPE